MPSLTWQILRRLPAIGTDAVIVLASYALALALRFDGSVPRESWAWFAWAVPLIALGYIFANTVFGVYRTAWQYGSTLDAIYLGLATRGSFWLGRCVRTGIGTTGPSASSMTTRARRECASTACPSRAAGTRYPPWSRRWAWTWW